MLAARLVEAGKPLELQNVPVPDVEGDQVLVRVAGAGVCHTDLHLLEMPGGIVLPRTLGHENAGHVERLGPDATGFQEGDAVAVYGGWGCGRCGFCLGGEEQLCDITKWISFALDGGYAEFLLVPHARHVVPLEGLDPVEAAPLTDAGLTPYRAIKRAKPLLHGSATAVVLGVGGLGQFAVQILRTMTSARIIALDTDESKLNRAREYGADLTLTSDAEAAGAVKEHTGGEGAQVVLDLVGDDDTLALAAQSVARGGRIVLVGLAGGSLSYSALAVPWEAEVVSSAWGSRNELVEVLDLARRGHIRSRVQVYPLEKINDALEDLRAGAVGDRAVVTPGAKA